MYTINKKIQISKKCVRAVGRDILRSKVSTLSGQTFNNVCATHKFQVLEIFNIADRVQNMCLPMLVSSASYGMQAIIGYLLFFTFYSLL